MSIPPTPPPRSAGSIALRLILREVEFERFAEAIDLRVEIADQFDQAPVVRAEDQRYRRPAQITHALVRYSKKVGRLLETFGRLTTLLRLIRWSPADEQHTNPKLRRRGSSAPERRQMHSR